MSAPFAGMTRIRFLRSATHQPPSQSGQHQTPARYRPAYRRLPSVGPALVRTTSDATRPGTAGHDNRPLGPPLQRLSASCCDDYRDSRAVAADEGEGMMAEPASVVVVGAGLAGLRVVEELRARDYQGAVTLIGAEARPPYDRPPLSKKVMTGELDDTSLRADMESLAVDLRASETAIELGDGVVRTD